MESNSYNNQSILSGIMESLKYYPILSDKIIAGMYTRLINDGYTTYHDFEETIRRFGLMTQIREGLQNPFAQESPRIWEERLTRLRRDKILKDFAERYTYEDYDLILKNALQNHDEKKGPSILWHNLQQSSVDAICNQAMALERMPLAEQKKFQAQRTGVKVELIRRLLSDQLQYIELAKKYFSIQDLTSINSSRIGRGRIGSRAAGVLLSNRILHKANDADISASVGRIDSYFIGADEFYNFMVINDLLCWTDQKYKDEESIRNDYPQIQEAFSHGRFPIEIQNALNAILVGNPGTPLMVRSSSLLEDSFSHPFNSMYESIILPNQGTPEENLEDLLNAVRRIYASTFNPNAVIYRQHNGLADANDLMAVLIQILPGEVHEGYYFADITGIAAGISPYNFKDRNKDEGFLRFSVGLGHTASRRNGSDFVNIVELSKPNKRHITYTEGEQYLGQTCIHAVDLKNNCAGIYDIHDMINGSYPAFYLVAQKNDGDMLTSLQRNEDTDEFVVNCAELVRKTDFTQMVRDILQILEEQYRIPVMIEFTTMIDVSNSHTPTFRFKIHNCCPVMLPVKLDIPYTLPEASIKREIFSTDLFYVNGLIRDISYVVFIDPDRYSKIFGHEKQELCQYLAEINQKFAEETFIFAAASRWGTAENYGIPVGYREISNAQALVELSGWSEKYISDALAGTRFFQTCQEAGIYTIVTNADHPDYIDHAFFTDSPDHTSEWIDLPAKFKGMVRILSTEGWYGSKSMMIEMNAVTGITACSLI